MPPMSARVSPASSMAARDGSRGRSRGLRYRRRPMSEWPMPEITAPRSPRRPSAIGRLEERQPNVLVVLEDDAHRHAAADFVDLAVHDAGGETQPGLFRERDAGGAARRIAAPGPTVGAGRARAQSCS